jgi:hypothetical protein
VGKCRQRFPQKPQGSVQGEWPIALNQLSQAGTIDELHSIPEKTGAATDIVDVDDVGVAEPGGKLRLTAESLDHLRIPSQQGLENLEGDLPFQMEISNPVHPSETARAEERQQLVVVSQRSPKTLFPSRLILGLSHGSLFHGHRRHLEGPRVTGEVLQHFRRRQIPVILCSTHRAEDNSLDCSGARRSELGRAAQHRRIEWWLLSGDRKVEQGSSSVHVTRWVSGAAVAQLRGHEREAVRDGAGWNGRKHVAAVSDVRDDTSS